MTEPKPLVGGVPLSSDPTEDAWSGGSAGIDPTAPWSAAGASSSTGTFPNLSRAALPGWADPPETGDTGHPAAPLATTHPYDGPAGPTVSSPAVGSAGSAGGGAAGPGAGGDRVGGTAGPGTRAAYAEGGPGYGLGLPWRDGPDDTTWALLAHLSYFAFLFVGPLVIMFTRGKRSGFVRHQAVEALNLQISLAMLAAVCVVLFLLIVPLVVLGVALLAGAVLAVAGAVAASRGEAYRYPLALRLIR